MKHRLKRAAAACIVSALLAAQVLAVAEPIGKQELKLSDGTTYTASTMNLVSDEGKATNLHENIIPKKNT